MRYKGQPKTLPWIERDRDETKRYPENLEKYKTVPTTEAAVQGPKKTTCYPHSSMLNRSSSSAVIGLLKGLNGPIPFVNPRELGTRLLVGPVGIRGVADE